MWLGFRRCYCRVSDGGGLGGRVGGSMVVWCCRGCALSRI
jgi:hypothetical protein